MSKTGLTKLKKYMTLHAIRAPTQTPPPRNQILPEIFSLFPPPIIFLYWHDKQSRHIDAREFLQIQKFTYYNLFLSQYQFSEYINTRPNEIDTLEHICPQFFFFAHFFNDSRYFQKLSSCSSMVSSLKGSFALKTKSAMVCWCSI